MLLGNASYSKAPWAELTLYVLKKKVQFKEPETGRVRGVVDGQYALLPISSVMEDVRKAAELLRHREPAQIGKVEKHRYVSHQAAVISGLAYALRRSSILSKPVTRQAIFSRNTPA